MFTPRRLFFSIIAVSAICLYIALPPSLTINLGLFGQQPHIFTKRAVDFRLADRRIYFNPTIKLGLDLQGGTHLVLDANMTDINPSDRQDALDSVQEIISRRVDAVGIAEPLIQTSVNPTTDQYRLIVELPGVTDTNQAIDLIGQTAQLEFLEENPDFDSTSATTSAVALTDVYQPTGLTGKQLQKATVQFDPQTSQPVVALDFDSEGSQIFADLTDRNVGKTIAIALDGFVVTAPVVNTPITDGQAVIQGSFDTEEAKNLSIQLNAGALPVPVDIISQTNIGATLGQESIQQSLRAGLIGLTMVIVFMILYYGNLGLLAAIALIIYGIITMAIYKTIGVTLTLPGLAGFILSVGMAVDANILIFERYKEEVRSGLHWKNAMERGFGRAWDSIKDANVATLLITFILFNPFNWNFLNTSGMVRGFALTLALGILISLFTGIIVTRTLIRLFYQGKETTSKSI